MTPTRPDDPRRPARKTALSSRIYAVFLLSLIGLACGFVFGSMIS